MYYTINMAPTSISFECPNCEYENKIEWGSHKLSLNDDYDIWTGNITIECEDCGKEIEFDDVDVD